MKTCTKCGEEKELGEFQLRKSGRDGLNSACKACEAIRRKYRKDKSGGKDVESPVTYAQVIPVDMTCASCSVSYPLVSYPKKKTGKYGFSTICTVCRNTYRSEWGRKSRAERAAAKALIHKVEKQPLIEKNCTKCEIIKPIDQFYKKKDRPSGINSLCVDCHQANNKSWVEKNQDALSEYRKEYRAGLNLDEAREYQRQWRVINGWRARERRKERFQNDPIFRFKCRIRSAIGKAIRRGGFKKESKTEAILGNTFGAVEAHLITTAIKNYGFWLDTEEYHIDHIIPLNVAKTEDEVIKLNHYTNLQFLTPTHNNNKWAKLDWKLL